MMGFPELQPAETRPRLGELQEELRKAKAERSQAIQELVEAKQLMLYQRNLIEDLTKSKVEADGAKESERKMLESLVSQTKQLELTKMSLEEAKLEIRSLLECTKAMEASAGQGARNLERRGEEDIVSNPDEIGYLRIELKLALEAEERSRKAMDDLALALKEVATESNRAKGRLSRTQLELETARAKARRSKALRKRTEERLRAECERLKLEAEDSFAAWIEKEKGFINCMKISEEEIDDLKRESDRRLVDLQRESRGEISKLRDIVKQAVSEANAAKEALEIARDENSKLKDILSEKKHELQSVRQEYECLKVSEAAAVDSLKELKDLLAATTSMDSNATANSFETGSLRDPEEVDDDRICKPIEGFIFGMVGSPEHEKDRRLAISANDAPDKARSSIDSDDMRTVIFNDFDHIGSDDAEHERDSPARQRKKRQILRRLGDLLRKKLHK